MRWEEYYDKIGQWATSTAVSRISTLETFGPAEEIVEIIDELAMEDEKGAARLLKKAIAAGVKFTGRQLADLVLICDKTILADAIRFSADRFTTADLDALYCNCDDDLLIELAGKYKIPLPPELMEIEEAEYDPAEEEEPPLTATELAAEFDYILSCLNCAYAQLSGGLRFSRIDRNTRKRSFTVMKYAYLVNAQPYIEDAINAWALLEFPGKDEQLLRGIRLNISNRTMWNNYLFDRWGLNFSVQRQIRTVMKNIQRAYKAIQALRHEL